MNNELSILRASGLKKSFRMGETTVAVLRNVDFAVREGEFVAIEGRSGSGKSTLLHLLGALDSPDGGRIEFQGRDIAQIPSSERSTLRNTQFGFVFQFYHLLPELNVTENTHAGVDDRVFGLAVSCEEGGIESTRRQRCWNNLGMAHRLKHKPAQLSGGERQRVAIARALMNSPRVLFADEPTGNLDIETGQQIMGVLEKLHRDKKQTIVMVTHDRTIARQADRVLVLKDGRLDRADA